MLKNIPWTRATKLVKKNLKRPNEAEEMTITKGDSSYGGNFDLDKKNEIQHHT
jgi:hypothetical protein